MLDAPTCRCFLQQDLAPGPVCLSAEETRHLVKVRRLTVGDPVWILNGMGQIGEARLLHAQGKEAELEIESVRSVSASGADVTLVMGALKQSAWDELLPHLVELGVGRILRWQSAHAVSDIPPAKRSSKERRWQERMIQACKQSVNPRLPELQWMDQVADAKDCLPNQAYHLVAALTPDARPFHLLEPVEKGRPLVIWVGPEGDFSQEELQQIRTQFDAVPVSLGDQILRAETAALAFVTLLRLGR